MRGGCGTMPNQRHRCSTHCASSGRTTLCLAKANNKNTKKNKNDHHRHYQRHHRHHRRQQRCISPRQTNESSTMRRLWRPIPAAVQLTQSIALNKRVTPSGVPLFGHLSLFWLSTFPPSAEGNHIGTPRDPRLATIGTGRDLLTGRVMRLMGSISNPGVV